MKEPIDVTELLKKIGDSLEGEEKQIFEEIAAKSMGNSAYQFIKDFIDSYDINDQFDNLLCSLGAQTIKGVGKALLKEKKDKEPLTGIRAAELTCISLQSIIDSIKLENNLTDMKRH